ncbi:MAG: cation transporter, partial [Burkholderiaceae bacterium]
MAKRVASVNTRCRVDPPIEQRVDEGDTMKTSVIDVNAMLSVLSVDEVEKRIGEVPGVESVKVNFAAASATVRYDETRLDVGDIKSAVRQRGHEPGAHAVPEPASDTAATPAAQAASQASPAPDAATAPTLQAPLATKATPVAPPLTAIRTAPQTDPTAQPEPGAEAMATGMKMSEKSADAPKTSVAPDPAPADSPAPVDAPGTPSLFQRLRSWVAPADEPAEPKPEGTAPSASAHEGHQG